MTNEVITYEQRIGALSVSDVRAQVNLIQHVMREVMKNDEHYGVIPGTGSKPTLLKAGAEKLCLTFRLDPQYEITEQNQGSHLTVMSKCTLFHIPTGQRYGSGMGSCSTKESKYAYRQGQRKCPKCGAEAIIKGKDFRGDGKPTGWLCFPKKSGCGAKFKDGDEAIEKQTVGRIPNEDTADQYNTVLKMANKRSLVAAVLNVTAASDIFTQDIEDDAKEVRGEVIDSDGVIAEPPTDSPAAIPRGSDHAGTSSPPAQGQSSTQPTSFETRDATIARLCKAAGMNKLDMLAKCGVGHADEMTEEDYDSAIRALNRKIAKALAARGEAAADAMQP